MTFDPMSVEVTCVTLPKDHCVQVSWQYINVCGYSDQFCKLPHTYIHIHTYYVHTTYRMSDHIVSYWTQFRRDKKWGMFWGKIRKNEGILRKNEESGTPVHQGVWGWLCLCTPQRVNIEHDICIHLPEQNSSCWILGTELLPTKHQNLVAHLKESSSSPKLLLSFFPCALSVLGKDLRNLVYSCLLL